MFRKCLKQWPDPYGPSLRLNLKGVQGRSSKHCFRSSSMGMVLDLASPGPPAHPVAGGDSEKGGGGSPITRKDTGLN